MRRTIISALTLFTVALGFAVPAAAESTAEDAVKYRQYIMRALSGHGGAVMMITGGTAGDAGTMSNHLDALANLAAEVAAAFAQNAVTEDSESLPVVWEDPDRFADAVAALEAAVTQLGDVAGSGDAEAIDAAVKGLRQSCRDCHDNFRVDD